MSSLNNDGANPLGTHDDADISNVAPALHGELQLRLMRARQSHDKQRRLGQRWDNAANDWAPG